MNKIKVGTQLPCRLHRALKVIAANDGQPMDALLEIAVRQFLKRRGPRSIYERLEAIEHYIRQIHKNESDWYKMQINRRSTKRYERKRTSY